MPGEMQFCLNARRGDASVNFRYLHENSQLTDVSDVKEFETDALARIDQRPNVGIANRHDSRKRCDDTLEGLEFSQTRKIRSRGFGGRLLGRRITRFLIGILLRDR